LSRAIPPAYAANATPHTGGDCRSNLSIIHHETEIMNIALTRSTSLSHRDSSLRSCVTGLLTSCGGGSSGSSTPAAPVTPTAPGNGLVTFANGIKFNTNVDPTSSGFQYDAEPGSSQWNFPVQPNYTLTGYGAEVGLTIAFTFSRPTSSVIIASYIEPGTMTMTFTNGQVENRYLANDTLGGLYLLGKLSTPSEPDDFLITNTSQSPQAFLGPSTLNGATWTGGFEGTQTPCRSSARPPRPRVAN
jgi:hypothetical protein